MASQLFRPQCPNIIFEQKFVWHMFYQLHTWYIWNVVASNAERTSKFTIFLAWKNDGGFKYEVFM